MDKYEQLTREELIGTIDHLNDLNYKLTHMNGMHKVTAKALRFTNYVIIINSLILILLGFMLMMR